MLKWVHTRAEYLTSCDFFESSHLAAICNKYLIRFDDCDRLRAVIYSVYKLLVVQNSVEHAYWGLMTQVKWLVIRSKAEVKFKVSQVEF